MSSKHDLGPLFTDITLSADDAEAIAAALRDIAETDGVHEEELALINELVAGLDEELGEDKPTKLDKMTPAKLAAQIVDPDVRMVAIHSAVLLAMADGAISDKERERCTEYATALGMDAATYQEVESHIVDWVKSGDLEPLAE
jgi:tellurite resistance protein